MEKRENKILEKIFNSNILEFNEFLDLVRSIENKQFCDIIIKKIYNDGILNADDFIYFLKLFKSTVYTYNNNNCVWCNKNFQYSGDNYTITSNGLSNY